ncbi:uncharacterized protein APUU_80225A [Aspergillus puulaauensis]|uniref:Uncharacterized protein n=1 Tax=Aspergillus puulaauensis TaxID=1220207 RepID=A0A7R8AT77_9EURO|nr:uncharacterized protein APUU_80225A [Aspergillus puulaauensis]BCS29922.1 hypothetical protein APUU_80225A [Aspergillus puulaauensis]
MPSVQNPLLRTSYSFQLLKVRLEPVLPHVSENLPFTSCIRYYVIPRIGIATTQPQAFGLVAPFSINYFVFPHWRPTDFHSCKPHIVSPTFISALISGTEL